MKKIVILSGAGISAESGISTFRDAGGLWEGHDIMEVASPMGWAKNPTLVNNFYNLRRAELKKVKPNAAHLAISALESHFDTVVITQNVDNLHERAGSTHIIHLHGELTKARSMGNPSHIIDWDEDLTSANKCPQGFPMRPHIVWFGEAVPMLDRAIHEMPTADIVIIVGTSMQVYPAASLIQFASSKASIYYIDPKPHISYELKNLRNLTLIEEKATIGMQLLTEKLLGKS